MSQHEYFHHSKAVADLNAIALRALAALTSEAPAEELSDDLQRALTDMSIQTRLLEAANDEDWASFDNVIADLVGNGTSYKDIANIYVPLVARTLGQEWVDGKTPFSTVSIGCARLQGYLRQKGLNWSEDASISSQCAATTLLIVPEFEQHTLGATLLAGQLRARGIDVTLSYLKPMRHVERLIAKHSYDALMVSSSRSDTLALLTKSVSKLRKYDANVPIIIGGNVTEQVSDVAETTGADFTTNCWQEAEAILVSSALYKSALKKDADQVGRVG